MKISTPNAIAGLAGALALCAAPALAQSQQNGLQGIPADAAGGTLQRGVPISNLPSHTAHGKPGGGVKNLIDHGGRILPATTVYYIWWGNYPGGWPSDASTGLDALVSGLQGSNFQNDIFPQYMRGSKMSWALGTSAYDSSTPPSHGPKTSTILNEVTSQISSGALPLDANAIYVVLTSNFPSGVNYCAWHSWGSYSGTEIQFAYMPNTTGVSGCNDPQFTCNSYSAGTDSIANVLSHELSEAITDADGSAWYDSSGAEIGDKCAWQFQTCVDLSKTSSWQLQEEWSNSASGCVQQ
jgi:hypothetical protein